MKYIYKLIVLFAMFFACNVLAVEVDIKCPEGISAGSSGTCTVTATTKTDESYTLEGFSVKSEGPITVNGTKGVTTLISGTTNTLGTVVVRANASSGVAKVIVNITLASGENTFDLPATSDSITIVSSDNTLKSITINDKTITISNRQLTSYDAEVKGSTVEVKATANDSSATITGLGNKKLACGDNKVVLNVKASNGDTKNYTLTIKRVCEENVLKDIKVSSGKLSPNFDKSKYDYTVTVSKEIEKITIKAVKNFDAQKITGEVENASLQMGSNKFVLTATNEENKQQKYNVTVIRDEALSTKAYLTSLSLSSGKINFDQNVLNYSTRVLYEVEKINVMATPLEDGANIKIEGNDNLKVGENTITVTVTTKNNEQNTYTILVNRLKQGESIGDNPNIKSITVNGYNLNFNYDKSDYKLLISEEEKLDIKVEMEDDLATYQIAGNHDLKDKSKIKIVAKSADELKTRTYTIEIAKPHSKTIFYIIGIFLLLAILGGIALAYYLTNKKKKEKVDVNGLKLDEEAETLTTNKIIGDDKVINTPIINDHNQNKTDQQPTKCPFCQRELLNLTETCPYCKNKLF